MTLVLPAEQTRKPRTETAPRVRFRVGSHRVGLGALLALTALLYLWNLSASGWANSFYSAAAQAGASNWTAFLFGSSDAANAITVDKTPAALWVMDISVHLFGLNPWSVLVPQALEGVAAVALLYVAVRRVSGPGAALLAGAVLALTPSCRADVPLQQSRLAAGARPGRGCLLHTARLRKGQQPLVVGRGRRRGGHRLSGQDAAGLPGVAGIPRRVHRGGQSPASPPLARCGLPCRGDGRVGRVVSASRRIVAVGLAAVHRWIATRQHRRIDVGLQRHRPADRRRNRWARQHELRRRLGAAVRSWNGCRHRMAATRRGDLPRRRRGGNQAGAANRSDPCSRVHLGWLAAGHGGGVQLHERHRAPLLHGGAGPGDRRSAWVSAQHCCGTTVPRFRP